MEQINTLKTDDFFYKIIQITDKKFVIEVPATRVTYEVVVDVNSEVGF